MRIVASGLSKTYTQRGSGAGTTAIEHLDLVIDKQEIVAVVGRTGCGKSTFFNMLLGLEAPTAGELTVDGRSPAKEFDSFRGEIGVVFQEDRLLPWRTALGNVELGLEVLGHSESSRQQEALTWLERMGLEKFVHAYPGELSGGMRQRVSIARAFCLKPKLILADESFGHLDEVTAASLRQEFVALVHETRASAVFITHQLDEAIDIADRTIVFGRPGRVLVDVDMSAVGPFERDAVKGRIQYAIEHDVPDDANANRRHQVEPTEKQTP